MLSEQSNSQKLTRKKIKNVANCACFGFIKFGVGTFFASDACIFLILNIKNF
jgi:hypothetical protein|tara:strand:- start:52 stop:207 length:156 start_codon:yes stop_codon:yes gene_type:complete